MDATVVERLLDAGATVHVPNQYATVPDWFVHADHERVHITPEVELCDEAQSFRRPAGLGDEVTGVPQYHNTHLAVRPFQTWPEHVQTLEAVRT